MSSPKFIISTSILYVEQKINFEALFYNESAEIWLTLFIWNGQPYKS